MVLGVGMMVNASIGMETMIGLSTLVIGIACVGITNQTLSKIFVALLLGMFIRFIVMVCKEEYEIRKRMKLE